MIRAYAAFQLHLGDRAGLSDIAAWSARGVLYGPMGDDIPRELRAFAEAATPPVQL